jgi:hypothetical protein
MFGFLGFVFLFCCPLSTAALSEHRLAFSFFFGPGPCYTTSEYLVNRIESMISKKYTTPMPVIAFTIVKFGKK